MSTMPSNDYPARRGVYLISHPRSASNLFQRMLAKQPGYQNSAYKFLDSGFGALMSLEKGPLSQWQQSEREALYGSFQTSWESLQAEIVDAEKNGKQALVKEHAMFLAGPDNIFASIYKNEEKQVFRCREEGQQDCGHTNPTILPDRFLLAMQPVFQIRHPALMFPSMIKALGQIVPGDKPTQNPKFRATMTLRYSRALYDWYCTHGTSQKPLVIDADEIMKDRGAVQQLCLQTGLDPDAIQYQWDEEHEADPIKLAFVSRINASTTIIKGLDAEQLDVAVEKAKWVHQFGEDVAEDLAKLVEDAMPDYKYLWSQRTQSSTS